MVIIVFGLPGSGKSFFAQRLAETSNAVYICSDRVRKKMFDRRTYEEQEKLAVYNEMLVQTLESLKQNEKVVLDATFYKKNIRERFKAEVMGLGEIYFIEVTAEEQLIRERLQQKRAESEADTEVYNKIKQQWEPMAEHHLILRSTGGNIGDMLQKATAYLHIKK